MPLDDFRRYRFDPALAAEIILEGRDPLEPRPGFMPQLPPLPPRLNRREMHLTSMPLGPHQLASDDDILGHPNALPRPPVPPGLGHSEWAIDNPRYRGAREEVWLPDSPWHPYNTDI